MQIVFGVALLYFGAGYHCLFIVNECYLTGLVVNGKLMK
jgi:hypothetical protein